MWAAEQLLGDLLPDVLRAGGPGDDDGGGSGQQQRGKLRHQAVADGQQRVELRSLGQRQIVLQGTDRNTTQHVDEQDQDAGDSVAAHELAGTVHGAVEVGFLYHLGAPALGLGLIDDSRVEVGVDGHLLAGHGVQGEPGAHFGHAAGALGHHHEVDDGQDGEDHQADGIIAADHEMPERLDHLASGIPSGVTVQQHHPGRGHVEGQPQQGGDQQHGGKHREIQRSFAVDRRQQHHQRQGDVEGEKDVQREGWQRHDHHHQDDDEEERRAQAGPGHAAQGRGQAHRLLPSPIGGRGIRREDSRNRD